MLEVDEEEEDEQENTLSAQFLLPDDSPKTLKRKRSLVDLVLVSAHHRCMASATDGRHTYRTWLSSCDAKLRQRF